MTADERLALIQAKIERADKHILNLKEAIRAFYKANPYKILTKRNPQTRQLIYYVTDVRSIPNSFALIAGDAIQNIRTALDHLAYQLLIVGTGGNPVSAHRVRFLTERGADEYRALLPRIVKGMRQDAIDALSAIEPYKGGRGHQFWVLNELNKIDKHRLLVTVSAQYESFNAGAHMAAMWQKAFGVTPELSFQLRPADRSPLKDGDELLVDDIDAEPNQNIDFRFDITLNEPGIVEGESLVITLQHLRDLVSNTVLLFKPCLA